MFNTGGYSLADISAATGGANRNNDNLFGGNGAWIIIILFLFVFLGWGKNGFGNDGGSNGGGSMPTIVNLPANSGGSGYSGEIQRGFDTQSVISKLDGLSNGLCDGFYAQNTTMLQGFNGLQNTVSNGFHGVDNAICNLGYNVQQGFNTTNIALMQGQNALQTQLANCCCENREGQAQIRYDMATNTCALQNTMNNNTRDIIDNQNAGTREILNYLCQKENADLRAQIQRSELTSALATERAFITANQDAQTAELVRRLGRDYPVNAVVVQPNTPVTFPVNGCGNFTGYNSCNGCCA